MIKYIGSKRKLIEYIYFLVDKYSEGGLILDAFSGTSRVSYALKSMGCPVVANDHNTYAHTIAQCYIEADTSYLEDATKLVNEFNGIKPNRGWFTETYCENSRYLQQFNGEKVDAIRDEIEKKDLPPILKAVVLTALVEAADRVDSTVGLQMAYLKKWSKRSFKQLELRVPKLIDGHIACGALNLEAQACVSLFNADVLYLDPPYNQHSYLGNYHVWESLVLWDKPEVYGIAHKRIDCKERKSGFNSKRRCWESLREVVENSSFNTCIMSYSDEGFMKIHDLLQFFNGYGEVSVYETDHKRHICSQIGVFNKQGVRVGVKGKEANKEYFIVCKGQEY